MIIEVRTGKRTELLDITQRVQERIRKEGIREGFCYLFVPHTTAAITINENADPDVPKDLTAIFERLVPWEGGYLHREGNSAAHMKTTLVGASELVAIENGRLVLGTWQSLFFCEFDGPRTRKLVIKFMPQWAGGTV